MKKVLSIFTLFLAFTYMAQAKRDTTSTPPTKITIAITSESGSITLNGTTPTDTAIVNGVKVYYGTYDVDGDAVALKATPDAGFGFQQWESNDPVDAYFPFKIVPTASFNLTVFSTDGYINVNTKPMTYIDTLFLLAKYYDITVCNFLYPISEHGYFNPTADKLGLGSNLALDSTKTFEGVPAIIYTQALGDGSKWPWINLNFELSPTDSAFSLWDSLGGPRTSLASLNEQAKALQITYAVKTTALGGEWKVVLPFNAYLTSGDAVTFNGGGDHMVVLPIKENEAFFTYTAYITDFKVPAWYDGNKDSAKNNPLIGNLDKVKKIGFKLNSDARNGECTGELYIKSIKVCGKNFTSIEEHQQKLNEITINGLVNNTIQINAQKNGNYNVSMYSIDGKVVFAKSINLNNGANKIQIGSNLNNGIYMIKVSNENGILTKKTCSMK